MSALIDPKTLHARMQEPGLKLVDASYPAILEFHSQARIGDAVMFDIDAVSDQGNPLPHMLPSPEVFAQAVGEMGIGNNDQVVVYDQSGMAMAASRVWWMFRIFGHRDVKILNGGMPLWHALDLPLTRTPPRPVETKSYVAHFNPALVVDRAAVLDKTANTDSVMLDARAAERFDGTGTEIRPGIKAGHIPGSYNLSFKTLFNRDGTLHTEDPRIKALSRSNPAGGIVTSCGSGVTACVLALALYEAGYQNAAVYDGSWTEWAQPSLNMPIETGPGKKFQS